mgnify:CR=1 FL=1
MTLLDEAANPARILFCVSRDDLYRLRVIRDDLDHIIVFCCVCTKGFSPTSAPSTKRK